jgi:hypothetical protein
MLDAVGHIHHQPAGHKEGSAASAEPGSEVLR